MKISILGSGTLSNALQLCFSEHNVTVFDHNQCDFLIQDSLKMLSKKIADSDYIINTVGIYNTDSWNSFTINCTAPSYLLECLAEHHSTCHFIMIGSHAAMWTSWPGIDVNRLSYNVSKLAITEFIAGLSHSHTTSMKLSIINPSRFESTMSNNTGYPIKIITDAVQHVMFNPVLLYELESPNVPTS